jgi:hypothetical protein
VDRRRRAAFAAVALGALLALVGCGAQKEGSGVEAAETREVATFSRIELSGEAGVVITVGEAQQVTVRGDDNLLEDVETEVDDGTLEISQPGNVDLQPRAGLTVEVTVPDLEAVEVSGAGNVSIAGLRGGLFRIDVSGAGNVEASGQIDRVEAEVSGVGHLRLGTLVAREATVSVSGAGDVEVHATDSLSASVSGAGDIVYTGGPENVETDVSGAGEIRVG